MDGADIEDAVLRLLRGRPGQTLTRRQIQGEIGDVDSAVLQEALILLRRDRLVEMVGKGRWAAYRMAPPPVAAPLVPLSAPPELHPRHDGWDDLRRLWREDLRHILRGRSAA